MPIISVKVENGVLVRKGLQNLADDVPKIGREQVFKTMQKVYTVMRKYPPVRPGSKYVRTGRLRDSVRLIKASNTGYSVEVDPVSRGRHYGKYVVGDARGGSQAWFHVGWWHLFADVVEEEVQKLPSNIEEHIRRVSKGYGIA